MSAKCACDEPPFPHDCRLCAVHEPGSRVSRNGRHRPSRVDPHSRQRSAWSDPCRYDARSKAGVFSPAIATEFRRSAGTGVSSEPEKRQFRRLFEDHIVRVYSQRFAQYRGETLRVNGSRSDSQGALVKSEIVRPECGPPIKVDWRPGARDGLYKSTTSSSTASAWARPIAPSSHR